jgi:hypothetical protein
VTYSEGNGDFHRAHLPYGHGGPRKLLRFDYEFGKTTAVPGIGYFGESVLCSKGNKLVTSEGTVFNVLTGAPNRAFTFPFAEKTYGWRD